jgi:hypothetical protein
MIATDSHRAALFVELDESDRVTCRFFAPEKSSEEICAQGTLDANAKQALEDYDEDLEYLAKFGIPEPSWLSAHKAKRGRATAALIRIGLPEPIGGALHQLRGQIGDDTLLLELSTESLQLDCLPWELLGGEEAASHNDSTLVVWRYVRTERLQAWPRKKILLVSASPPEKIIGPNVDVEFDGIRNRVAQSRHNDVQVEDPLMHCTATEFDAGLLQTRPNILHMAMHGDRESMYFERAVPRAQDPSEAARPEYITKEREVPYDHLVYRIADTHAVVTAILSVCYSASRDQNGKSFTRKLIEAGVPSAIGMASSVTPAVSAEFCRVLYREICEGKPVADAYGKAVVALRALPPYDECLWSVPMLYGSDNVIPLPTEDYMRFLGNVRQATRRMQELRRNLARLSLQADGPAGNWNVNSTKTAMGIGKVQSGLRYLRDNATPTRAESYLWKLQFDIAYRDFERKLGEVRACMTEVNAARGPAALSRSSQRFKSAAPLLISELDNLRRLVVDEFPAVFAT